MVEAAAGLDRVASPGTRDGHRRWIRICHWIVAAAFVTLVVSGILILMVHPRLYWGEVGNDLTPALFELPISANHQPDRLERTTSFTEIAGAPVSAYRNFEQFNENGWARSLHFLAGWFLVLTGLFYLLAGLVTGHVRRNLLPRAGELAPRALSQDLRSYLYLRDKAVGAGPPYGLLQKLTYTGVVLVALPLMLITGLTMAPAVTAAHPWLLDLFGGYQSARTVHFFGFVILVFFLTVHLAMVIATGFRRQLRAMLLGR